MIQCFSIRSKIDSDAAAKMRSEIKYLKVEINSKIPVPQRDVQPPVGAGSDEVS